MATKQKSGLYRTKIKIGTGPDGKPIYKYLSGRTKKELEQAKADAIAFYIDGESRREDHLFGEYAVNWFRVVKSPSLSASSISNYRSILNKYILPKFGDRQIKAIRPIELQAHFNDLRGMARTCLQHNAILLSGIFSAAVADGIISRNPMQTVKMPQVKDKKERRPMTPEERATFEAWMPVHPHGAFVACLYYLGLRHGEAVGLKWGDIDFRSGTVSVRRSISPSADGDHAKTPKTRRSIRDIPMPDALADILRPLRGHPDAWLFPSISSPDMPMLRRASSARWFAFIKDAGLSPEITPHYLRHNYITMCWENGIDPYITMSLVGHESITTTMDIYTHLTDRKKEEAAAKVGAMFAQKNKVAIKLQ